jgi:hypothetical protein
VNGKSVVLALLALFALIGAWMLVYPVRFIAWFKSARPDLRYNTDFTDIEDNPEYKAFVKFLAIVFICGAVVCFIAFAIAR